MFSFFLFFGEGLQAPAGTPYLETETRRLYEQTCQEAEETDTIYSGAIKGILEKTKRWRNT